ncbi:Alpha/Beta hydrolase protein [Thelonectria olida]|uniref:Alpha/Beta hydrolase protein n=1 Tax=Thelonectria olida TaxID=1576542 RepID=A0A9P8W4V7_9HYPO|nr:Alpha/Beta hydrolase protein [Thelonectria olida]
MTGLKYDPEYAKAIEPFANAPRSNPTTALEMRRGTNAFLRMVLPKPPPDTKIQETNFLVRSFDGVDIQLRRFATVEQISASTPQPAVLALHGGGLVAGDVDMCAGMYGQDALDGDRPVFAVEYRLPPENVAPAAVEDGYACFKYLLDHAAELNIDPHRIAIKGGSAGGAIAVGLVLLARDRELSPQPAKQILVYPMLDDRTTYPADTKFLKLASWSVDKNKLGWGAYLGEDRAGNPDADVSPYAAPARAKSYKGLPSTYIDVGTLDIFRDEGLEFARRLMVDDVEAEFHLWPGIPHAFEHVSVGSKWERRAAEARIAALRSF